METTRRFGLSFWMGILLTIIAGVLLLSAVWTAVGNLILVPQFADGLGLSVVALGWFWLIAQVALPVIVATLALLLTRAQSLLIRGLVLLAAAATISVISIDIMHAIPPSAFFG